MSAIIQHVYPGTSAEKLLELTKQRNVDYCKKHSLEYQCHVDSPWKDEGVLEGHWARLKLVQDALDAGHEHVCFLDADTVIRDLDVDIREACKPNHIGACWHRIPQGDHWNTGVLYFGNGQATKDFLSDWMASYPGLGDGWAEQGVFNLFGKKSKVIETLSDKWNATINVNMVPDAVVIGFHGVGGTDVAFTMMQQTLNTIGNA